MDSPASKSPVKGEHCPKSPSQKLMDPGSELGPGCLHAPRQDVPLPIQNMGLPHGVRKMSPVRPELLCQQDVTGPFVPPGGGGGGGWNGLAVFMIMWLKYPALNDSSFQGTQGFRKQDV